MKYRNAQEYDYKHIKKIANQNRKYIPFFMKVNFNDGLSTNSLIIAENNDGDVVGFIRWHQRNDGINTIHELAIENSYKNKNIGTTLLSFVPNNQQLKVTTDNFSAIEFYKKNGFKEEKIIEYEGNKRNIIIFKRKRKNIELNILNYLSLKELENLIILNLHDNLLKNDWKKRK